MSVDDLGVGGIFVTALLGAWFVLSIPHQFTNRYGDWIKRINLMGLIPAWTFFAPTPGTIDYRLVYRDKERSGFTEWHELQWCTRRRMIDAVWHPERHRTKLIIDCVSAFILTVKEMSKLGVNVESDPTSYMISVPYMALLNIINGIPRSSIDAIARQFAVIEVSPSNPTAAPNLIVCSSAHEF